jgi:heme/copper-type cytochrome/quinol oxidase subunit 2
LAIHPAPLDLPEIRRQRKIRLRILIWLKFAKGWYMSAIMTTMQKLSFAAFCTVATMQAALAIAQDATEIQVTYSNGQFQPNELRAPADRPVVVKVRNLDPTAMEFESESLRVEKVVAGKTDGIISVRALKPGRYKFHDDFNDKARGALTVQ